MGGRGLGIFYKLHRKGLNTVCIPRSIENDIAATLVSFGFNSALSVTIEMLDKARQAAQSARKIAVVEVLGEQAGWIALQAGIAACADAILIPEIPCRSAHGGRAVERKGDRPSGRGTGWWWWPKGRSSSKPTVQADKPSANSLKASLSPLATGDASEHVIQRAGQAAETVATRLQLLIAEETYPLVVAPSVTAGVPTAVDRQLGLGYGAGAIRAVKDGTYGVMVAYVPPAIEYVPLADAINKVRTVPMDNEFIQVARSLGICLGREL